MQRVRAPGTKPELHQSVDALLESLRAEIQIGLDDIAAGRIVDAETAFAEARRLISSGSSGP